MKILSGCPVCRSDCEIRSDRGQPYTVYRCGQCGTYSFTNELAEKIANRGLPVPDAEVFRNWVAAEPAAVAIQRNEGPLITENTFKRIKRTLN